MSNYAYGYGIIAYGQMIYRIFYTKSEAIWWIELTYGRTWRSLKRSGNYSIVKVEMRLCDWYW